MAVTDLLFRSGLPKFIFSDVKSAKRCVDTTLHSTKTMSFQLTSSAKNTQLLGNVLSLYMSNDNLIHKNLSFVLDIIVNHRLFNETREPSEELASVYRKWTVRLNSLLQSKNVAARWCGITLVRVTCENSHTLLIGNAKTWSAQLLGFVGVKYM